MTLTEILAMVRSLSLLSTDDLSDSDMEDFVQEGNRRLAGMFDWPWNTSVSTTADITGGSSQVTLPSDLARMRVVLIDGEKEKLAEISAEEAWERWGDDLPTGTPRVWWFLGDEFLHVAPVPASNTDLKIHYWADPSDITSVPDFAAQFHGILVEYALWRIWQREEDYTKAGRHEAAFNQFLNDMVRFYFNHSPDYPLVFGEPSDYMQRRYGTPHMPWLDGV